MSSGPAVRIQKTAAPGKWQWAHRKECAEPTCTRTIYRQPRTTDECWEETRFHSPECRRRFEDRNRAPRASEPTGWRTRAACLDEDAELFFPVSYDLNSPKVRAQVRAAKSVCARCPVIMACRDDALRRGDNWAILAGLTPKERFDLDVPGRGPR